MMTTKLKVCYQERNDRLILAYKAYISLIKSGSGKGCNFWHAGPSTFMYGSFDRYWDGDYCKLFGIGKFQNRCHGDWKNTLTLSRKWLPANDLLYVVTCLFNKSWLWKRCPGATIGHRNFIYGSIRRARPKGGWKFTKSGKVLMGCHGNSKCRPQNPIWPGRYEIMPWISIKDSLI